MQLREITHLSILFRLGLAALIGGLLGMERGRRNRPAGLRTHMLVCLGAAIVMMTNQYVVQCMGTGDPVRMGAQVISGIGFLGAGAIIITHHNRVTGLTTAAGLWAAACIGLAVGIGFYEVAVEGGAIILLVLSVLHKFDQISQKKRWIIDVFIELSSRESMPGFLHHARETGLLVSNLQMESEAYCADGSVAFVATVQSIERSPRERILSHLKDSPGLEYIEEL